MRICILMICTLAAVLVSFRPAWNQNRGASASERRRPCWGDSVIKTPHVTPRLPISDVGDFRSQTFKTAPIVLLSARVIQTGSTETKRVQLTVENISSRIISVVEYAVWCADVDINASVSIDKRPEGFLKPKRKATLIATDSIELEPLLRAAPKAKCKPLLSLLSVEFSDGSCWRPYLESVL